MNRFLFKVSAWVIFVSMILAACTSGEPPIPTETPVPSAEAGADTGVPVTRGIANTATPPAGETTSVPTAVLSETPAASSLSGTLTVLFNRTDLQNDGTLARYSEAFSKKYPGVIVKWETMADYPAAMLIRMKTPDYGDVLLIPPAFSPDKLVNFFTPLGSVDDLGKKYMYINEAAYQGQVFGIAVAGNGQGLVYNREIFKAAGITALPRTPEEFQNALKAIKEKTKAIPLFTNYHASWLLTQWDSQIQSVSGDPNYRNITMIHMDNPFSPGQPAYIVYKVLYDAVKAGYTEEDPVTIDWTSSKTMIARGDIGVMALGPWALPQIQAAARAANLNPAAVGYMPFPYNKNGKQYAASSGDYKIAINKNSPNQAAARAFVSWFLNESNFAFDQGGIPPVVGAKLPPQYVDFANAGVNWVIDNPAKPDEEGYVAIMDKQAGIGFSDSGGAWQYAIVDAARGKNNQTFDAIMNDANARWAAARKFFGITP